jgi:hypothetical protein
VFRNRIVGCIFLFWLRFDLTLEENRGASAFILCALRFRIIPGTTRQGLGIKLCNAATE